MCELTRPSLVELMDDENTRLREALQSAISLLSAFVREDSDEIAGAVMAQARSALGKRR